MSGMKKTRPEAPNSACLRPDVCQDLISACARSACQGEKNATAVGLPQPAPKRKSLSVFFFFQKCFKICKVTLCIHRGLFLTLMCCKDSDSVDKLPQTAQLLLLPWCEGVQHLVSKISIHDSMWPTATCASVCFLQTRDFSFWLSRSALCSVCSSAV